MEIEFAYKVSAFAGTCFFVLQMVLSGFSGHADAGGHVDGGMGHDAPGDGASSGDGAHESSGFDIWRLFTVRNAVSFLMGFGWAGVLLSDSCGVWTPLAAFFGGLFFVSIMFFLVRSLVRLESVSGYTLDSAVGRSVQITVSVGAEGEKVGRGQVIVRGSLSELPVKSRSVAAAVGESHAVVACVGGVLEIDPKSAARQ